MDIHTHTVSINSWLHDARHSWSIGAARTSSCERKGSLKPFFPQASWLTVKWWLTWWACGTDTVYGLFLQTWIIFHIPTPQEKTVFNPGCEGEDLQDLNTFYEFFISSTLLLLWHKSNCAAADMVFIFIIISDVARLQTSQSIHGNFWRLQPSLSSAALLIILQFISCFLRENKTLFYEYSSLLSLGKIRPLYSITKV